MKARIAVCFLCVFAFSFAFSALPPQYQNKKDLTAMISFIDQHPQDVLSGLMKIDLVEKKVYFMKQGKSCIASFKRLPAKKGNGEMIMPGPAADLVLDRTFCTVKN